MLKTGFPSSLYNFISGLNCGCSVIMFCELDAMLVADCVGELVRFDSILESSGFFTIICFLQQYIFCGF